MPVLTLVVCSAMVFCAMVVLGNLVYRGVITAMRELYFLRVRREVNREVLVGRFSRQRGDWIIDYTHCRMMEDINSVPPYIS